MLSTMLPRKRLPFGVYTCNNVEPLLSSKDRFPVSQMSPSVKSPHDVLFGKDTIYTNALRFSHLETVVAIRPIRFLCDKYLLQPFCLHGIDCARPAIPILFCFSQRHIFNVFAYIQYWPSSYLLVVFSDASNYFCRTTYSNTPCRYIFSH